MSTQSTATVQLVTAAELHTLGIAAAILKRIEDRATSAAWHAPSAVTADEPRAQAYGRVAAKAESAKEAIWDAVLTAEIYGKQHEATTRYNRGEEFADEAGS